ncbi:MAG: HD domain-containing phosphohydrolase [Oleispira sp.]
MDDLFEINNEEFKPTLLLVDDEENILKAIRRALRSINVNILMATSGKQGLEFLEQQPVNLIISDMRMPEMTGAEFLSQAAQKYPDIPRILMTGYSDMESTVQAINDGRISNYLPKPWNDDALKSIVADGLQSTQLKQHNAYLTQQLIEKQAALEALNINLEKTVEERTEEVINKSKKLEIANEQLSNTHNSMVSLISNILALRDEHGSKMSELKANIARDIAKELELSEHDIQSIYNATLLSNIGKMTFTDKTLDKPYNTLSKVELETFKKFPVLGEAVLIGIPGLSDESKIIRCQFERYNGLGFPDGLEDNETPLGSKILAIARDYVELVQGQYTGKSYEAAKARAEIKKFSGERYHPEIVKIFIDVIERYSMDQVAEDEKRISARDLQEQMILSRNIYSTSGVILLKKDHIIDTPVLNKIINFEQLAGESLDIYIYR